MAAGTGTGRADELDRLGRSIRSIVAPKQYSLSTAVDGWYAEDAAGEASPRRLPSPAGACPLPSDKREARSSTLDTRRRGRSTARQQLMPSAPGTTDQSGIRWAG